MRTIIAILLLMGITVSFKKATDGSRLPKVSQRRTVASLTNQQGLIRNVGSMEKPLYIIHCQAGNLQLIANNIPHAFQKDSLAIVFSGQLKESISMEEKQCLVLCSIRKQ